METQVSIELACIFRVMKVVKGVIL